MADTLLIAARAAQYAGVALLFGLPVFRLYGLRGSPEPEERRALMCAATALAAGAGLALSRQAAGMTGDEGAALDPSVLRDVLASTQVGQSLGVRMLAGLAALAVLVADRRAARSWAAPGLIGGLAAASFPWSGHAGAAEGVMGVVLLGSDLVHVFAAALWLGAVAAFGLALRRVRRGPPADRRALIAALEGFAGTGSVLVALIAVSGAGSAWLLAAPAGLGQVAASPYGALLGLKLVLVAGMLGCAALNRWRITPALQTSTGDGEASIRALGWSLGAETACGAGVLAVVAALGTLPPGG